MKTMKFDVLKMPELTDEQWAERDAKIAEQRERESRAERAHVWDETKGSLIRSGMSERHLEVLFKKQVEMTPAMRAIETMSGDGIYILSGNVGCGKTLAAHAWLVENWKEWDEWVCGRGLEMRTASWFARASRYETDGLGRSKFEQLGGRVRRLVLDDLGVEYADAKGSFLADLDELLDIRWRKKVATLITTNLPAAQFKERYGQRVYDRCRGQGRWFDVKHGSMRGG